jgi:hypothetical protein
VHQVEVLGVHRDALQNGCDAAHDDEANLVADERLNQTKESVFHGRSRFPQAAASPPASEGTRAASLGGKRGSGFDYDVSAGTSPNFRRKPVLWEDCLILTQRSPRKAAM